MTLTRWMRVRLEGKPEKRGRVENLRAGRPFIAVQWDGNKTPSLVEPARVELDPAYSDHNEKCLRQSRGGQP